MPSSITRNLVTGGAGFLGSHLIDRLMEAGEEVICLDNYFTGRKANISCWIGHPQFELIRHDVTEPIKQRWTYLASGLSASPIHYQFNPVKTAKTSFLGTYNMWAWLGIEARLLLASTSEVYGDLKSTPSLRATRLCESDRDPQLLHEGKRIAETPALTAGASGVEVRVMRISILMGRACCPTMATL